MDATAKLALVNWDYDVQVFDPWKQLDLGQMLRDRGAVGWELIVWESLPQQVGPPMTLMVTKRPAPSYAPPIEIAAGWLPDPSQRFATRYWDGLRWTEHVMDHHHKASTDLPYVKS
ncbi:MAG: hypothetical protein JWL72_1444 [Ilumatobacteraceae bacterium]|nr:hypothetical protein [Ilumatobacteraceae bacterium]